MAFRIRAGSGDLGKFFMDLVERALRIRPVEAGAGCPGGELFGAGEGGQGQGDAVQSRRAGFFGRLDGFPIGVTSSFVR